MAGGGGRGHAFPGRRDVAWVAGRARGSDRGRALCERIGRALGGGLSACGGTVDFPAIAAAGSFVAGFRSGGRGGGVGALASVAYGTCWRFSQFEYHG